MLGKALLQKPPSLKLKVLHMPRNLTCDLWWDARIPMKAGTEPGLEQYTLQEHKYPRQTVTQTIECQSILKAKQSRQSTRKTEHR